MTESTLNKQTDNEISKLAIVYAYESDQNFRENSNALDCERRVSFEAGYLACREREQIEYQDMSDMKDAISESLLRQVSGLQSQLSQLKAQNEVMMEALENIRAPAPELEKETIACGCDESEEYASVMRRRRDLARDALTRVAEMEKDK